MSSEIPPPSMYVTADYRRDVGRSGVQTRSAYFANHFMPPFGLQATIQDPGYRPRETRIAGFYYETESEDEAPVGNFYTRQLSNQPRLKRRRSGIHEG